MKIALTKSEARLFAQVFHPDYLLITFLIPIFDVSEDLPIMRRCFWIGLYQFGILNTLLYRFLMSFPQCGGHLGNMQIR